MLNGLIKVLQTATATATVNSFTIILAFWHYQYNVRFVFLIYLYPTIMVFFKTILIILLVYYGLKILVKMFAPKIFGYAAKKTAAHFKEKFGQFSQQNPPNEERVGDVIIDKKPPRTKTSDDNTSEKVGDYIDFEEID